MKSVVKAPEGWRTPRSWRVGRSPRARRVSWSAAALRRFWRDGYNQRSCQFDQEWPQGQSGLSFGCGGVGGSLLRRKLIKAPMMVNAAQLLVGKIERGVPIARREGVAVLLVIHAHTIGAHAEELID